MTLARRIYSSNKALKHQQRPKSYSEAGKQYTSLIPPNNNNTKKSSQLERPKIQSSFQDEP